MALQPISLGGIREGHLHALLDANTKESRVIKYRGELRLREAIQTREWVYDASG